MKLANPPKDKDATTKPKPAASISISGGNDVDASNAGGSKVKSSNSNNSTTESNDHNNIKESYNSTTTYGNISPIDKKVCINNSTIYYIVFNPDSEHRKPRYCNR